MDLNSQLNYGSNAFQVPYSFGLYVMKYVTM